MRNGWKWLLALALAIAVACSVGFAVTAGTVTRSSPPLRVSDAAITAEAAAQGWPSVPADWLTETPAQLQSHGWAIVNDTPDSIVATADAVYTTHLVRKILPVTLTQGGSGWTGTWKAGPGRVGYYVQIQRLRASGPTYRFSNLISFDFWWNNPLYGAVVYNVASRGAYVDNLTSGARLAFGPLYPSDHQYACGTGVTCHTTTATVQVSLNPCNWVSGELPPPVPYPGNDYAQIGINMWPNSVIYWATSAGGCT